MNPALPASQIPPRWSSSGFPALWALLVISVLSLARLELPAAQQTAKSTLQVAFSSRLVSALDEKELKGALKAWGKTVLQESGAAKEINPIICDTPTMIDAFQSNSLDVCVMTMREFLTIKTNELSTRLIVGMNQNSIGEEYLLLVPHDSRYRSIADLKDKTLEVFQHHSMALADEWLELLLSRQSLPSRDSFFHKVNRSARSSSAVLPVFFRKSDTCLVTRRAYETMVELNPQVGQRLKVLESSPRVVPMVFWLADHLDSSTKDRLYNAITSLSQSPSGKQILSVFQTGELVVISLDRIEPTRALIEEWDRMRGKHLP